MEQHGVPMELSTLFLGEPLINDLLYPSKGISKDNIAAHRVYMRNLIKYMQTTGKAPYTQKIEVNKKNEVIGGNHRILSAWLLGWTHVPALPTNAVGGWRSALTEDIVEPLAKVIGLDLVRGLEGFS